MTEKHSFHLMLLDVDEMRVRTKIRLYLRSYVTVVKLFI